MPQFFEDEPFVPENAKNFKVRCIDDSPYSHDVHLSSPLIKGNVYNVEGVVKTPNGHGFLLTGMTVMHVSGMPMAFAASRFTVLNLE